MFSYIDLLGDIIIKISQLIRCVMSLNVRGHVFENVSISCIYILYYYPYLSFHILLSNAIIPSKKGVQIMADVYDTSKRSEVMQKVRSRNNKSTELKVIKLFKDNHISGWRRHYNVKGHPDFIFPNQKVALFIDGCFWHGHNCRNLTPKTNIEYWEKKQAYNKKHDSEITSLFERRGWTVLRIWECELKKCNIQATLIKIEKILKVN